MLYIVTYEQLSLLPFGRLVIYSVCQPSIFTALSVYHAHERVSAGVQKLVRLCLEMKDALRCAILEGKCRSVRNLQHELRKLWDIEYASIWRGGGKKIPSVRQI